MRTRFIAIVGVVVLVVAALPASVAGAQSELPPLPLPVDISSRLKNVPAPAQPYFGTVDLPAAATTVESQCGDSDEWILITISSFDPAHPGEQDVIFWKESVGDSATLWVAWDFLATDYGPADTITCAQLAYLQTKMDSIVDTDVDYFGQYEWRPFDNPNIDVMIYNIVDESYYDPAFEFYIAGFFWAEVNEDFDRNMIFIDSLDWANRLGPNISPWRDTDSSLWREYLYEGTVAHELEHLIHHDKDADEDSWVDEGLADLAQYFNGFGHDSGHVVYYLAYHRTPLTVWGGGLESYGASYLFQLYLLENFGSKDGSSFTDWSYDWTLALVAEDGNSITGVENATGAVFNELYDAWVVANYIDDPTQLTEAGFPIGYDEIDLAPFVSAEYSPWSIERGITAIYGAGHKGNLPTSRYYGGYRSGNVEYPLADATPYTAIYGLYKGMEPELGVYLRGDALAGVPPNTGDYEVSSGGGHELTDRTLVLSVGQNLPAGGTLTFWTWYDIEEEWDYGFVEVSADGGAWTPLAGSITRTSVNPNNSTAWDNSLVSGQETTDTAITGNSGGWVEASFTLPAGAVVDIRFNYYTDAAVNGQGWFIDDVTVNGFSDGFEAGAGAWDLGGWAWTTGLFPNDWIAGYVTPTYNKGKFDTLDWGYIDTDVVSGDFEYNIGVVDTSRLNKDEATVFFANRPGDSPFAAGYLILVEKGNASE